MEQLHREVVFKVLSVKESLRQELQEKHGRELEKRD